MRSLEPIWLMWKDRPAEEFDLKAIRRWIGDSAEAMSTGCLEFFSDAEFLRIANIVDTPGTRSTIGSHEEIINDLLARKRDDETQRLGGEADAILYVISPVARQSDEEMLRDFEKTSRFPGSSPYNSLAVVHKWEMLDADDPYAEAEPKAERILKAMNGLVSAVIPASAPLGKAAKQFDDQFWRTVLDLTGNTPSPVLEGMLLGE